MQPHTLDPGYYNFMVKTARVPGDLLKLNAKNVRGFPVSQEEALAAVNKFRPTKKALAITKAMPEYPAAIPCEMIHPWMDGCNNTAVERFLKVCQAMFPVYGTLHFVPMLLLRNKHLRKE